MTDAYFSEMTRFRDQVLSLAGGRQPARDIHVAHLYIGRLSVERVFRLRDSIPADTFLMIYYPETASAAANVLQQSVRPGERTLFCPLAPAAYYADRAGLLASLFLNHDVTLSVDDACVETYRGEIAEIQSAVDTAVNNAWQSFYGRLIYLRNSIVNLRYILSPRSRAFLPFTEAPPAVVCSAGPSLKDSLPVLKKYADRIMIICVYRVLPLLLEAGIKPDFVVQVDPSDVTKTVSLVSAELPPLIACATVSPGIAVQFREIIWTSGDSPEFNAMAGELNIALLPLQISRTVTVTAIDFARFAGCRKIALVGSDLCLSPDGKCYTTAESEVYEQKFYYKVKGITAETVNTNENLDGIRKSIRNYIKKSKAVPGAPSFYNCSNYGAVIEDCRSVPLEKFCDSFAGGTKPRANLGRPEYPSGEELSRLLKSQAEFLADGSTDITKYASRLAICLEDGGLDVKKIRLVQKQLDNAVNRADSAKSRPPFSHIFRVCEQQSNEIDYLQSAEAGQDNVVNILNKLSRTSRMTLHLINGFVEDISNDSPGDLRQYDSLRNIFIEQQKVLNPKLAEYMTSSPDCSAFAAEVTTSLSLLRLPLWLTLPDRRRVYSDSATPGLEMSLRHEAKKQTREFIAVNHIEIETAAIIYVTGGNFFNLAELKKLNRRLPVVIVTPWAGVVDKISRRGLVSSFFTDDATVVCVDADSDWLTFCKDKIAGLKKSGRTPYLYPIPSIDDLPELEIIVRRLSEVVC